MNRPLSGLAVLSVAFSIWATTGAEAFDRAAIQNSAILASAMPIGERPLLYGIALTPAEAWGNAGVLPQALVRTARLPPEQLCQVLAAQWNAAAVTLKQSPDSICSWMTSYPSDGDTLANHGEAPSIFVVERSRGGEMESVRLKLNASRDLPGGFAAMALMNRQLHALVGWTVPAQVDRDLLNGEEFQLDIAGVAYWLKRELTDQPRYNFIISPVGTCWLRDAARFVVEPDGNCPSLAHATLLTADRSAP